MAKRKKKRKTSRLWFRDTSGKPNAILTLLIISFIIVTGTYLASILEVLTIGSLEMTFSEFNVGYATAVTLPLMAAYCGRKATDLYAGRQEYQGDQRWVGPNQTMPPTEYEEQPE